MSEPVAWAAFAPDASESRAIFWSRDEAENVCGRYGYDLFPLYAVRLTDAEREAVERVSVAYDLLPTEGAQQVSATLRGLLERMA